MKNKFLKIISVVFIFIALAGFWGYNKYFKPDPEIRQQLDNQFGAKFFTSFDDKKVDNHIEAASNVQSTDNLAKKIDNTLQVPMSEQIKDQAEDQTVTNSTPVNSTPANETPETIVAQRITQDDINNKYTPQFTYLQNVALSRLDTLYAAAIQEYLQNSKAGTVNRSALLQKYIQAGTMLEANIDSQFYSTLNAMQAELIANNLPTDIVDINKSKYEKAKSAKRSQLLAKAIK
ncbi:conserved hypothetical protein [Candidatus Desulfosporosinus infrequens]|uniref:Uncharacterized protein n=1 Tax=Candidatus Desulfosporosinus infrequens TaxID=2043169 RepID=A0A2U3L2A8_9FIRM|nr:conserved hypothetical protein [Candidatus Desulfosporosinus infrequens]